jgi:arylsulfatase A-like enzyme
MTPRGELLKSIERQDFNPDKGGIAGEAWIDDALGAVLNKLRQLGIEKNTLVLFAPDHGSNSKASLFSRDGTRIPMIAWWPGRISGGLVCDELVQNIDWVPTAYALAGVTPPASCRVDGRSLVPLLDTGKASGWRDHLYFEMGYARAIETTDRKYIAVRYPREVIAAIQDATPDRLPRLMAYIGRIGIGVRGADRPGFWDADQLYDLQADPKEYSNLASDPRHADELNRLRDLLAADIKSVGRPFGEFLPGGNAVPPGQVDLQIEQVKALVIQGKNVVVPKGTSLSNAGPAPEKSKKERRKKEKSPR